MRNARDIQTGQANIQFLMDPEGYLRQTLFDCTSQLDASIRALRNINMATFLDDAATVMNFDLVPLSYGKVGLTTSGLNHAQSIGPAVRARFLGFAYNVAGPAQMGKIRADNRSPLIFTVGLTGCTIIGVRNGGVLRFYHEPTRANAPGQWLGQYGGDIVFHATPATGHGSAVMHCYDGVHWRVYLQTFNFDGDAQEAAARRRDPQSREFFRYYTLAQLDVFNEA